MTPKINPVILWNNHADRSKTFSLKLQVIDKNFIIVASSVYVGELYVKEIDATRYRGWMDEVTASDRDELRMLSLSG